MPAQELRMIPISWPFAVWGLDMVGPSKSSKDKKTHLLVVVDKFTKWVEAEPVSKCDAGHDGSVHEKGDISLWFSTQHYN